MPSLISHPYMMLFSAKLNTPSPTYFLCTTSLITMTFVAEICPVKGPRPKSHPYAIIYYIHYTTSDRAFSIHFCEVLSPQSLASHDVRDWRLVLFVITMSWTLKASWLRSRYSSPVFYGLLPLWSPSIRPSAVSDYVKLPHHYCPRKGYISIPSTPLPSTPIQHTIQPQIYSSESSSWSPLESFPTRRFLKPEELLRVVSWNIDFMAPGREQRACAAMDHLRNTFGPKPPPIAVMLQEVHAKSLSGILEHPWVRDNFAVSNTEDPQSNTEDPQSDTEDLQSDTEDPQSDTEDLQSDIAPQSYFTIMMVSKHIETEKWFRVPFESNMERDALFVDIPLSPLNGEEGTRKNILRLCTTHLESLLVGETLRPRQLAQISALLKSPTPTARIVGGVVGGDMNSILPSDQEIHKAPEIDLRDVWEDIPPPPIPPRTPGKKDLTFGRARGATWGYQGKSRSRKRLDKFFYTGLVDTVMLEEAHDRAGKVGRLGIGERTKVTAMEIESTDVHFTKSGKVVEKLVKEHLPASFFDENYSCPLYSQRLVEIDAWISDHFAITVGVRVKKEERGSAV
jgi:tyrosyl-DNA phosphodiesterase 2